MGGGRGAKCPLETFHREIFGDKSGKMRQEKEVKMENVEGNAEKMENERKKMMKNRKKLKKEGGK